MSMDELISELENRKASIEAAIAALNGGPKLRRRRGRSTMSAEARKKISLAQKKRWREQKKTKA